MKKTLLSRLFLGILILLASAAGTALLPMQAHAAEPVKIGVLAFRYKLQTMAQWQPLADALNKAIPDHNFVIKAYSKHELSNAVANRQIDFVLTNSGHYILLKKQDGLSSPLATLQVDESGHRTSTFGGVIFTRADQTHINTLNDIKGKAVAVIDTESFGGYQMQAYELSRIGMHLSRDIKLISTGMPQDNTIAAVLDGRADVGFVRTGILESMVREGKLNLKRLKIINRQQLPGFPILLSTHLYPEWPFAAMPNTDDTLARHVAAALFTLEENTPATHAMGIRGFGIPADYAPVEDLLRELRLPPYDAAPKFTLRDIWERYHWQMIAAIMLAGFASLLRLAFTRRKLRAQYRIVVSQQQKLQESESRLKASLDAIPDLLFEVGLDGRIYAYYSPNTDWLFVPPDKFLNKFVTDVLPHDAAAANMAALLEANEHGHSNGKQYSLPLPQGEMWFELSVARKAMLPNETARFIVLARNITKRKQIETKLLESESRLRTIIENEPECIKIIDAQGLVRQMNPAGLTMIEADSPDQIVGLPILNVVAPEYQASYAEAHKRVLGGEAVQIIYEMLGFKGGRRWMESHAVPMQDNGETVHLAVTLDITERKHAEEKLQLSDLALKAVSQGVLISDARQDIIWANDAFTAITGYNRADITGRNCRLLQGAATEKRTVQTLHQSIANGTEFSGEILNYRKDGTAFWNELSVSPVRDTHGHLTNFIGITRDVTERKHAEEKLKLAANVFTYAREGIIITDADGNIIDVNDTFTHISGYSREEVLGRNPRLLSSGRQGKAFYTNMWRELRENGHWYGEVWNRSKDGEVYAEMLTISAVRDIEGSTTQYVALFSDITAVKEHEQQLEHIAHYDALTTLPNRVLLADRMHQAMIQIQRRGQRLAVVYLDLDGFKIINDRHGHEVGDQLLISLANRMKEALREGDTLARLGGDEFVAVLLDLPNMETAVPLLNRMRNAAAEPIQMGDFLLQVSASLGITFFPQSEDVDADQLLRQADQAMYQAKLAGKNRYHVFDAEQDFSIRSHHENIERMRHALAAGELVLHYQPKVNMRTGAVIGAEALIRWQHPEQGLLSPAVFLPIIEDNPLMVELGEWVMDTALGQMSQWHASGLDIPVSINIAARQLQRHDFVDRLRTLLAAHPDINSCCIELEVLETSALEDMSRISGIIEECRGIGVMFSLDDFGTGYSSLTYLKHLPVNQLKIDQSFVRGMLDNPEDIAILGGILGLASAFRRQVIAEGVETVQHGAMLLQLGCDLAQGYAIARPMPAHELPDWVATWRPDPAWDNLRAVSRDDFPLLLAGVEHRAWVTATEDFLKGACISPPPMNHHQCRFGSWLDAEGLARYGKLPGFRELEQLHRQAHDLAVQLADLCLHGQHQAALDGLNELHALRDSLLSQLNTLTQQTRQ
jgi:diguanylate cyclase (GGDEF)-like protein/PAS domain S-box-containing protein